MLGRCNFDQAGLYRYRQAGTAGQTEQRDHAAKRPEILSLAATQMLAGGN